MIEDKNQQRTELSDLGEFGLIEHLTKNFKVKQKSTIKSIGDDAAVLEFKNKKIVKDSQKYAEVYINSWVTDQVILQNAKAAELNELNQKLGDA